MDPEACAETAVDVYRHVDAKMAGRFKGKETLEEKIAGFQEAMDVFQTAMINDARGRQSGGKGGGQLQDRSEKPKSDVKCRDCGNQLTVGEKKYCDDTKKPYLCYSCSHK